jgi:superfamily II DNA or RNA helicase
MVINIDNIEWGPIVPKDGGYIRQTPMTPFLWECWKHDKAFIKSRGMRVFKTDDGFWILELRTDSEALPGHAPLPSERVDSLPPLPMIETSCGEVSLLPPQIPHVQNHVRSLRLFDAAVDSSQTGTGKTACALMTAHNLGLTPVVICPKVVISSWQEWGRKMGIAVHVTNYEQAIRGNFGFVQKTGKTRPAYMMFEWMFRTPEKYLVIFDEAHRLKGEETKTACLAGSLKRAKVKSLVLSATLCESPLDLKNIGYLMGFHCWSNWQDFLKSNGCFTQSFTVKKKMRSKWGGTFTKDIEVKKWIFAGGKKNLASLHSKIFPAMGARLTVQDMAGHFPDNHIIPMQIAIGGVEKVYQTMRKELRELEAKKKRDEFTSDSKLTIMLRAQQEAELLKVPSIIEMAKDMEEEGNSVVVFCQFTETLQAISKALGGETISGAQKGDQRDVAIAKFQSDKSHFMVVQIQAGGAGVSLHQDKDGMRPRTSILMPVFDGRMLQQALGRIHRAGAKQATKQYIVFDSKSKSDVRACKAIEKKVANMEAFNGSEVEDLVIIEPKEEK